MGRIAKTPKGMLKLGDRHRSSFHLVGGNLVSQGRTGRDGEISHPRKSFLNFGIALSHYKASSETTNQKKLNLLVHNCTARFNGKKFVLLPNTRKKLKYALLSYDMGNTTLRWIAGRILYAINSSNGNPHRI